MSTHGHPLLHTFLSVQNRNLSIHGHPFLYIFFAYKSELMNLITHSHNQYFKRFVFYILRFFFHTRTSTFTYIICTQNRHLSTHGHSFLHIFFCTQNIIKWLNDPLSQSIFYKIFLVSRHHITAQMTEYSITWIVFFVRHDNTLFVHLWGKAIQLPTITTIC